MASWQLKENRDRNKPMIKLDRERLAGALAVHDRIQGESDEIRARHGLPIVPESPHIMAARGRLLELESKAKAKPKRKTKAKAAKKAEPVRMLAPEEEVEAIANFRAELEHDQGAYCDQPLAELAQSRAVPVARIADGIGVTRQAIYQLADRLAVAPA